MLSLFKEGLTSIKNARILAERIFFLDHSFKQSVIQADALELAKELTTQFISVIDSNQFIINRKDAVDLIVHSYSRLSTPSAETSQAVIKKVIA